MPGARLIERCVESPLGGLACIVVRGSRAFSDGVCVVEYPDGRRIERHRGEVGAAVGATVERGDDRMIDRMEEELGEYFAGTRRCFDVAITLVGTEFRRRVWGELVRIGFGETASYGGLASRLGLDPATSARAVAGANGANRVSIVVPCHRVIGGDGTLVGYAGGLERKRWLLEHERSVAGTVLFGGARSGARRSG